MLSTETARLDAYSTLIPRHPGKRGAARRASCFVLRAACFVRRAACGGARHRRARPQVPARAAVKKM
ncbi:hypothetical protein DPR00_20415 [Burkholderia pseudomallei]|nr:hypothetical protein CF641_21810 [Burkholderia pseudomallei]PNX32982.1 hypothetical protein CF642_31000 [Burkholderia pseudomallei]RAP81120.1 hypothetical protein DPQ97_29420 [Burkholderia pseudomallei]RAP83043.1 hypothetical protein DPR01_28445 [Burkholderia pseudomallei]RAP92836.1 hypothetical protein DPQ99_23655 [Burkholderia pseudomallei]